MSNDPSNYTVRRPRYVATGKAAIVLSIVRAEERHPAVVTGELVDISRHGICIKAADPLEPDERLLIRLKEAAGGLERSFAARGLWRQQETDDSWLIGCALEGEVDWETLGELFLQQVIDP